MNRGILITFEGIDGSGKSTQVEKLAGELVRLGHTVQTFRDPGATQISEQIRAILLSNANKAMSPLTELLLYEAARAQIVAEKIRPALEQGHIVIVDRFFDSTTAYQGYGRGLEPRVIAQANHIATGGLMPDRTFFIDVTWEEARRRRSAGRADRMESEDELFFHRIRNGYIQIAQHDPQRVKPVDGNLPAESVAEKIREDVLRTIRQRRHG